MNKTTTFAAALIAIAAFFLFSRLPLSPDTFAGIFTGVFVLAVMALEYGFSWKRLLSR